MFSCKQQKNYCSYLTQNRKYSGFLTNAEPASPLHRKMQQQKPEDKFLKVCGLESPFLILIQNQSKESAGNFFKIHRFLRTVRTRLITHSVI